MSWQSCPDPVHSDRHVADAIETVIVPSARDLGGFEVRRALPSRRCRPVNRSQLDLFRKLESFSEFGFEIAGGAFQFLMPEQELDGFEIASLFEDQ